MKNLVSAIVPVYCGDDPDHFATALNSLTSQTHPPDEIIVVADGPLTNPLNATLKSQQNNDDRFDIIRRDTNQGQGLARAVGTRRASNDLVAFLDADDFAVPDRFEQQVAYFNANPDLDALGGAIEEFGTNPDNPHARREPPTNPDEVADYARFRSPINNTTAMVRRNSLIEAGNYRAEEPFEDYRLWLRMVSMEMTLANLPNVLAKVRAGDNGTEMAKRRGGFSYAYAEVQLFHEAYRDGTLSMWVALLNLAIRIPIRLMPNQVRTTVYEQFLRN